MEIYVSKHAIQRYRERLFDFHSAQETIESILSEAAIKGSRIFVRPSDHGGVFEIKFRNFYLVINDGKNKLTVITCLGDKRYRKWLKDQFKYSRMRGSILHRPTCFSPY